jgi:dUTP pyrophosphatase
MKLIYEKEKWYKYRDKTFNTFIISDPQYAHKNDSGIDIYSPISFTLEPDERITINLGIKFKIQRPLIFKVLNLFGAGLGVEIQIRPKSGRSKKGIEVSLGTIDQDYRNYCGATIHNYSDKTIKIDADEKLCQAVVVPVFNKVKLVQGEVDAKTERGLGGFGSTSLK